MAMDGGGAALLQVNVQAIIIEYLIRNVHMFFDQDAASAVIVANPRYSTGSQDIQAKMDSDPGTKPYDVVLQDFSFLAFVSLAKYFFLTMKTSKQWVIEVRRR